MSRRFQPGLVLILGPVPIYIMSPLMRVTILLISSSVDSLQQLPEQVTTMVDKTHVL